MVLPSANQARYAGSSRLHREIDVEVGADRPQRVGDQVGHGQHGRPGVEGEAVRRSTPARPPGLGSRSTTVTSWPRPARWQAAASPARPAPITTTGISRRALRSRQAIRWAIRVRPATPSTTRSAWSRAASAASTWSLIRLSTDCCDAAGPQRVLQRRDVGRTESAGADPVSSASGRAAQRPVGQRQDHRRLAGQQVVAGRLARSAPDRPRRRAGRRAGRTPRRARRRTG